MKHWARCGQSRGTARACRPSKQRDLRMATRACVCHEPPCPQQTAQACSACQDLRTWLAQVHQGLVGLGQRLVKKNAARHRPPQHGGQAVKAAEGLAAHAARRAIASGCKAIAWGRGRGVQQNGHTFSIHVGACCRRPAGAASGAAMSQLLDPIPNALAGRCGGRAVCQSIRPSKPGQWLDQGRKERSSGAGPTHPHSCWCRVLRNRLQAACRTAPARQCAGRRAP